MLHFIFATKSYPAHEQTTAPYRRRRWYAHQPAPAFAFLAACFAKQGEEEMLQKAQEGKALQEVPGEVELGELVNWLNWLNWYQPPPIQPV